MTTAKQRQECFQLYNEITEGLELAYENQEINEAEFSKYKIKTLAELEESLADLTQLKDTELIEYSNMNTNYANFNMQCYFVPALLEQIENDYETLEDGLIDIQNVTGFDDEDIEGLLTGELVPTPQCVDILNELFYETSTDNNNALGLQVLAAIDRGDLEESDLEEGLQAYYDSQEDEEELDDEDEEDDEVEDSDSDEDENEEVTQDDAVYSYIDPRLQELESKIANFELNSELKNRLNDVAEFARQGLEDRWLSRAKYDFLLGSFDREEDRVAAFSQAAEEDNVDLATRLYAVLFALEADEACGERVTFSSYISEPQTAAKRDDDELALLQIKKMVENRQLFNKN